jgi:hypothetical protein
MLKIKDGRIINSPVVDRIQSRIEKGEMAAVNGIIVHQTGGATAQSAFNAYLAGAAGAHLLMT